MSPVYYHVRRPGRAVLRLLWAAALFTSLSSPALVVTWIVVTILWVGIGGWIRSRPYIDPVPQADPEDVARFVRQAARYQAMMEALERAAERPRHVEAERES